jgi:chaperone BCS1
MEALLNYSGLSTDESTQQQKHEATPPLIKHTTLSGLLNIIDGAASIEGRLLILTTNHANQLGEALV